MNSQFKKIGVELENPLKVVLRGASGDDEFSIQKRTLIRRLEEDSLDFPDGCSRCRQYYSTVQGARTMNFEFKKMGGPREDPLKGVLRGDVEGALGRKYEF
jgi:hypothetical protein